MCMRIYYICIDRLAYRRSDFQLCEFVLLCIPVLRDKIKQASHHNDVDCLLVHIYDVDTHNKRREYIYSAKVIYQMCYE